MTTAEPKPKDDTASVEQELYRDASRFDFYQAVALLEQTSKRRRTDEGVEQPPVRFGTPASTAFPASAVDSVERGECEDDQPRLTANFMGLTGPSGVLPRHYTELLIQLDRRLRGGAKRTLGAWYDLFNNRLIGQMYRAWTRRRIDRGVTEGRADGAEPDSYTAGLFGLAGLAQPGLRNRLQVLEGGEQRDRVADLALLKHAGTLARRQRSAAQIERLLSDYFRVPVRVKPFQGQWLQLEPEDRTELARDGRANQLGVDAVVGSRVWNVQSRVRVCVGPLDRERFEQFMPDTSPGPQRRRFVMLCQLTRLLLGPELDYDVQLVLDRGEVPRLTARKSEAPARLGWNAWLASRPLERDGDDPVFEPIEATALSA
ncbi:hypothetical protein Mal64_04530 [Pseudobythopirellula maris]|uniref:Type VI secretion protein n=1 Tax=Pseudobythopirellula maris TaxID=2527991 RepID=A0A5C5ZRZ4_9BACT|nr:type VI secretion system baseplate subunit TssG [Pseudobythopirellula maris]TWT90070.1 hypothetical protein Mal64_04530 [Pseudobythopirellula maris]